TGSRSSGRRPREDEQREDETTPAPSRSLYLGDYVRVQTEQIGRVIFVLERDEPWIVSEVVLVHLPLRLVDHVVRVEAGGVGHDAAPIPPQIFEMRSGV